MTTTAILQLAVLHRALVGVSLSSFTIDLDQMPLERGLELHLVVIALYYYTALTSIQ